MRITPFLSMVACWVAATASPVSAGRVIIDDRLPPPPCVADFAPLPLPPTETITVGLTFEEVTDGVDSWLEAPFDVGSFPGEVIGATVEFRVAESFEGYASSSSNSFYTRGLSVSIEGPDPPPTLQSITSIFRVSPDQPISANVYGRIFRLFTLVGDDGFLLNEGISTPVVPPAPPSWAGGQGSIRIAIESTSSLAPLPTREIVGSTRTLMAPPGGVLDASVTFRVAAPEPAALTLVAVAVLARATRARRRAA